jgi:mono/diheme cytochrome c family protein
VSSRQRSLLFAAAVCLASCTGKYVRPTTDERVEVTPERVERGKYLVDGAGACGVCHTTWVDANPLAGESPAGYLAGGNYIEVKSEGYGVWVPNITPEPDTGLGKWTDDQIMRAIRDGIHADGHLLLPFMPFPSYQHLSDEDVRAVVAYLRSVPPQKQTRERIDNQLPFVIGIFLGRGVTHHEPKVGISAPSAEDEVRYGKYLAEAAHCPACHSLGEQGEVAETDPRYMAGSTNPMQKGLGKIWASNVTPDKQTGIGEFSAEQIKAALTSGDRLDGARMGSPMAELVPHYAKMTPADLDAIVAWLQSLAPSKNDVPDRELNEEGKKRLGK